MSCRCCLARGWTDFGSLLRRAGLSNFPQAPLSRSAYPTSDPRSPSGDGHSPSPGPSDALQIKPGQEFLDRLGALGLVSTKAAIFLAPAAIVTLLRYAERATSLTNIATIRRPHPIPSPTFGYSSSRPRGLLRWVERCWPATAQARRSEIPSGVAVEVIAMARGTGRPTVGFAQHALSIICSGTCSVYGSFCPPFEGAKCAILINKSGPLLGGHSIPHLGPLQRPAHLTPA